MSRPFDELRFVDHADVYKAGRRAAVLRRLADGIELAYVDGYLGSGGPPLATTLPGAVRTRATGALPPFFAGLLPEGRRLSALRRWVKTSADDDFSLLLAVGADTVGDVQVVPEGEPPDPVPARVTFGDPAEVRFADLYATSTGTSAPERVGLPGVQAKVSAVMITLPVAVGSAGVPCILKLSPPELPHLVENEAFFLDAARASGIKAVTAEVVRDADGTAGLLVRRFDRLAEPDGRVRSLAVEDGCQVLGRYPADKYNVTAEEMAAALVRVTQAWPVAAREVLRQLVFAYLVGNGDAHAKSFSVLRSPDGEWALAPAYDVTSSYFYGDHTMALRLAGRVRDDIGRAELLAFAAGIGVRTRAAAKAIDELVERLPGWLDRVPVLPFDERRLHKFRRAVEYRRDRLVAGGA